MCWISYHPNKDKLLVISTLNFLSIITVIFLKVLLDPSMTKGRSREWKELQTALSKVSSLVKVHQLYQEYIHVHLVSLSQGAERKSALLPLFSKTGLMKLPAVKYANYTTTQYTVVNGIGITYVTFFKGIGNC